AADEDDADTSAQTETEEESSAQSEDTGEETSSADSSADAESDSAEEETSNLLTSSNSSSSSNASSDASSANSSSATSSSSSSGVTGSDVVAYAVQFVGNPYVWGGTSLTNGCDCSGFVVSVYAHFGYSLPHFSGSLRYCGTGVSYSEAQPGDIICYDGHVGIYMGGGQMVNAFDTEHGIIICAVNTSRLVAVRRILT
ncbi:MAG: NlpC/P60 family protein, partial [Clostridiales bacterium]|nr:NlpC/P60 family protein [Clostridiales bacterium]